MSDFMVIKRRRATYSTNSRRRRYKLSRNAKKTASAIAYFKRKILTNENVSRGPDGYYTWLLKDGPEGRTLVAGHTRTQQELGTLHKNLDDFSGPGTIVAAGEFVKEEDHILFNLQSGSYMLDLFKRLKSQKAKIEKRDELIALATAAFATIAGLPCNLQSRHNRQRSRGAGRRPHDRHRRYPYTSFRNRRAGRGSQCLRINVKAQPNKQTVRTMSKDAMTRYEKRNIEDTVFLSFKPTSDTTFDFNVWSNIPGYMPADEYAEWLEPFHQVFMRAVHRLSEKRGLIVGSNIELRDPHYKFWFQVVYLGKEPETRTSSFMVCSKRVQ